MSIDILNPTQEERDTYDRAYLLSLPPAKRKLFAGTFGEPGAALSEGERLALAYQLSATMKVDLSIDGFARLPSAVQVNRARSGYTKFSYIGEKPEDWNTTRPGDSEPGVPTYDGTTHTGIVTLDPPQPYVPPPPPPAPSSLVGTYCNVTSDVLGIPGPSLGVYIPNKKGLTLPDGFAYTDPTSGPNGGKTFLFHLLGSELMDAAHRQAVWLGPV